ncbi:MAG TPA: hypothetical protein IAA61_00235 [Candidatus Ornithomonoglobus merdipullorum]|uniref:Uncharacterized protein n=1 Tax=Candidatus Ornithomonoglobus merdipullorum TaxID=2840895 RepID=A0A9D1M9T8_9FIRM|nr:hypothetical protein [Candidatus Ornithomonoglobus merdipullorum]
MIYGIAGFIVGALVGSVVVVAVLGLIGAATKIKESEEEIENERRKHREESERIKRDIDEHIKYVYDKQMEWKSQSEGE